MEEVQLSEQHSEVGNPYSNNTTQIEVSPLKQSSPSKVAFADRVQNESELIKMNVVKSETPKTHHVNIAMFGQENKNMGAVFNQLRDEIKNSMSPDEKIDGLNKPGLTFDQWKRYRGRCKEPEKSLNNEHPYKNFDLRLTNTKGSHSAEAIEAVEARKRTAPAPRKSKLTNFEVSEGQFVSNNSKWFQEQDALMSTEMATSAARSKGESDDDFFARIPLREADKSPHGDSILSLRPEQTPGSLCKKRTYKFFTPQQSKRKDVDFFKKRNQSQNTTTRKAAQLEQDKLYRKADVDAVFKKYIDPHQNKPYEKQIFANMHPTQERFNAILAGSGTSLGFMTFQAAKLQSPMDKFQFRRKQVGQFDTTKSNKKFFRKNENLEEFAKDNLPPGSASMAKQIFEQQQAIRHREEEEAETKKSNKSGKSKINKEVYGQALRHGHYERFQKGQAWYNSSHPAGQIGVARKNECYDTFYSAAHFKELEEKVKKGGMRPPKKVAPPQKQTKNTLASEYDHN